MSEAEKIIITAATETGDVKCIVTAMFEYNNRHYIAFTRSDEESETEIRYFSFTEQDDRVETHIIDDDTEFDEVSDVFDDILNSKLPQQD